MKKKGRKDGAHEPYFKGSSNEAVQCLEEGGTWTLFFNKKFMVSILSLVPYIFSVLSPNPQMSIFIIVDGLWKLSQAPKTRQ